MLSDDLDLPNTLQVSKELRVAGSDESRFTNGRVYIGSSDPSLLASNNNDLYVSHDTEVGIDLSVGGTGFIDHNTRVQGVITVASTSRSTVSGDLYISADASITNDLSVYGSTCLGDSAADSFIVTSRGVNVADNGTVSDTDSAVRLYDDLSITGELSVAGELEVFGRDVTRFSDGRVYIGSDTPSGIANEAGDLYVQNDTEVGGSLSIGGDVSITGVIFNEDYTAVIENLTAGKDIDVRGKIYDGVGIEIDILDDLSVSGDLTVWSSDIHLGLLDGDDDALRFSGDTERIEWDEATDDFQITDDLSLTNNLTIDGQNLYLSTTSVISDDTAAYTEFSPQADVLAIRDSAQNQELRVYDSGGAQYVTIDTDVTPDARVQVTNGNLYIQTEGNSTQYLYFTMEDSSPYIGTVGSNLGINTENNQVHIADGESLFVDRDTLTVDGPRDRLYVNALSGTHTMEVNGSARVAHDLTVSGSDIYMGSGSGSLQFADYSEKLEWQAGADEFAVTDDVSISGTLTVPGVLRVGSLESAALYNAIDTDGDLRVTAGLMDAANDLYVEGDVEVAQNLSLGGDVTIIGVVFSDDYTEIKGTLTSSDDLDVRGRIYDGGGVAIDILDDLSVSGNVTVDGESFIATHTTNTDSDGVLNLGRNNNEWETIQWDDSEDRFAVSGNLDLTHTGVVRITLHDGVRRSDIHFDTEEYGFHMDDSLSISDALTVWNGYISSDRDLAINPGIGNARILELGGTGESDTVLFEAPATTVSGYLSVSSDVTVDGIIYGSSPTNGTEEDRYIIDTDDTTDTPTVALKTVRLMRRCAGMI